MSPLSCCFHGYCIQTACTLCIDVVSDLLADGAMQLHRIYCTVVAHYVASRLPVLFALNLLAVVALQLHRIYSTALLVYSITQHYSQ